MKSASIDTQNIKTYSVFTYSNDALGLIFVFGLYYYSKSNTNTKNVTPTTPRPRREP